MDFIQSVRKFIFQKLSSIRQLKDIYHYFFYSMSITYVYAYNMVIYKDIYIFIFIYMNQMNYAYIDEAYSQTNLINENKINTKKSNWFNRICNYFRSLCCCFSNNNSDDKIDDKTDDKTIVEINLTEIIEPNLFKI